MKKIIIIGTLHAELTPEDELREVLEKYSPDQLLLEIAEEDVKNKKIDSYPPEMIFAFNWAKNNKVRLNGFDSKIDSLNKGLTKEDEEKAIQEQKAVMKNFTWRDMNKLENLKKLYTDSVENLIDWRKEEKRELEMLNNIKSSMIQEGVILILTGCGHLAYFERRIKDAIFPFR